MTLGSSLSHGSHVCVGVDISSGELVAVTDWQLTSSSSKDSMEPACQADHIADCHTQVLLVFFGGTSLCRVHKFGCACSKSVYFW